MVIECNDGSPRIKHVKIDGYQVVNPNAHPREELVRNLALWEARGPDDYWFEFQWSSMCPQRYHMPVRIAVTERGTRIGIFRGLSTPQPRDNALHIIDSKQRRSHQVVQRGWLYADASTQDPR